MVKEKQQHCSCGKESESKIRSWNDEKAVKELINRLNRIEGQVRGIRGMIEKNVYCDDVLNQIASVNAALRGVAKLLLEKHMKACVLEQLKSGDDQVIDEVLKTIFKMMK